MTSNARRVILAGIAVVLTCVTGCVTVPKGQVPCKPAAVQQAAGVYHKVTRGQTLWRIARMYGVDIDRIAGVNNIQDATQLEVGQRLFIPGTVEHKPSFAAIPGEDFLWPINGAIILGFGQTGADGLNKGLNIRPDRDHEVKAARSGRVVFYNDNFLNFGKAVIIDHGDGFLTVYAGSMSVSVKPGDEVVRGAVIAQAGSEAVHFEIRKGVVSQNPYFYLSH